MKYLLLFVALILMASCSNEQQADKNEKSESVKIDTTENVVTALSVYDDPTIEIDTSTFSKNEKIEFLHERINKDTLVMILSVHKGKNHYELVDTALNESFFGGLYHILLRKEPKLGDGYLLYFSSRVEKIECYNYFEIEKQKLICKLYYQYACRLQGLEVGLAGSDGLRYAGFLSCFSNFDLQLDIDLLKNIPHQFRKFKGKKWCDMIALWKKITSVKDVVDDHIDDSWRAKEDTIQCL